MEHISDTAFWIAAYRAQETNRTDAVFKDTLAGKLAGIKGEKIVAETPHNSAMAFAMVVRTVAIDRLVLKAISEGIDTIINLGAGLDTRPYRLSLPANLNWIEVDFETLIHYKNELLTGEVANCKLTRIAVDLSNDTARKELLEQLGRETKKALVITEGVIGYLTNDAAARLSQDIYSIPSLSLWIQDYSRGKMRRNKQSKDVFNKLKNTPILFDVEEPIAFFGQQGWKVKENIYILDEADRIGRSMTMMFPWNILIKLAPPIRNIANKTYGYVMFSK